MLRILLGFMLISACLQAKSKGKKASDDRFMKAYQYIFQGCKYDYQFYKKLATEYKAKAKSLESKLKFSTAAKIQYGKYKELTGLYEKIALNNLNLINCFTKNDSLIWRSSLEDIPKLEEQIKAVKGKHSKRMWLTVAEVRENLKMGYKFKNVPSGVLPHFKKFWYDPKTDKPVY